MVQVTYPGVYIVEKPSGVKAITSVATSIAAFIGYFKKGPINDPVRIFSMGDFERVFGPVDRDSEASYQISQFFLNGGGEAYVVRVAAGTETDPFTEVLDADGNSVNPVTATVTDDANIITASALNEGEWGNTLRYYTEYDTTDPAIVAGDEPTQFNLYVRQYDSSDDNADIVAEEQFLSVSIDPNSPRYFPNVVNENSALVEVADGGDRTATDGTEFAMPTIGGLVGADMTSSLPDTADFNALKAGVQIALDPDGTGPTSPDAALDLAFDYDDDSVTTMAEFRRHFQDAVRKADPNDPRYADATVTLIGNQFVVRLGQDSEAYAPDSTIAITGADTIGFAAADADPNPQEYALTGGENGDRPRADDLRGQAGEVSGIYALETVDLFNILCIPEAIDLATGSDTVINEAIAYCNRKRAMFIVDSPLNVNSVEDATDWIDGNSGFRHQNAVYYFPRLMIPDSENEFRLKSVPACGTVAGLYARTDSTRGVWKAPAGTEAVLRGVSDLGSSSQNPIRLTDPENGVLNPLGVNCFRQLPIYGNVCWGGRTLMGADVMMSDWKYIPVRRLTLMIEETLYRSTKWVLFEPNDEPLWAKIRKSVGAYLMGLFRQAAFEGATPAEAFYVRCDGNTTTATDRAKGIVNIEVGFAALKPCEFVVITIQQMAKED